MKKFRLALYTARYEGDENKLAPLALGYLAAYLLDKNIVAKENLRIVDSREELAAFSPNIVGVSSVSQVISDARSFARFCKENFNSINVLGGYHVTLCPQKLPPEFDYGVVGEGEHTFAELVTQAVSEGIADPWLIPGLCFHTQEGVASSLPRPLISDLDVLPHPLRHRRYTDDFPIFTSRGCPYACIYCAAPAFWGQSYRLRGASSVLKEIELLVEQHDPKEIAISDDLWIAHKPRFHAIANGLIERKIPERTTFRGFVRSNIVCDDDIKILKKINYSLIRFGAETGSDRLLKKIKGNSASVAHHQRLIDLAYKYSLPCSGSFMFGMPGETAEDIEETMKFLDKNRGKMNISGLYFYNPIPGTKIYNMLMKNNLITDDFYAEEMYLDILHPNFEVIEKKYFNKNNLPLNALLKYLQRIKNEFIHN